MLASTGTIEAVAQAIHDHKLKTLVIDPVGSVSYVCLHSLYPFFSLQSVTVHHLLLSSPTITLFEQAILLHHIIHHLPEYLYILTH